MSRLLLFAAMAMFAAAYGSDVSAQARLRTVVLDTATAVRAAGGSEANLSPGVIIKDCALCPEMVILPTGTFRMGTPEGAREVDLRGGESPPVNIVIGRKFALGRTEITRGQFKQFVAETGYQVQPTCKVWRRGFIESTTANWQQPMQPVDPKDDHPVACVSWDDAAAFVSWLSGKTGRPYRLPSTAEWEYAARGGTETARYWGNSPDDACKYANTFDLSSAEKYPFSWPHAECNDLNADLAPVARFAPNGFGLFDMIGNVSEWQADCYAGSHQGRPKNARAWQWEGCGEFKEIRGGGWSSALEHARAAWPGRESPQSRDNSIGFRVARDLQKD